jgi:TolB-like protein/Tfp pilus assembly protein PilF
LALKPSRFPSELKRRKVYHVAAAYLAVGSVIVFGVPDLSSTFGLPPSAARLVIILVAIGFPIALVLSWLYRVSPEPVGTSEEGPEVDPGGPRSGGVGSVAVLPFANLSDDPKAEYFSDGMTEEIINALAQLKGLKVAARTSSFSFKGRAPEIAEVGAKLKVATVLEGSVRKDGGRLRITAQLVNVADGFHLWSERYDRQMEDVFAIQDDIARAIANRLKVSISGDALIRPPTGSLEAYDLYLRGRFFVTKGGEGTRLALDCFQEALARDPQYALAHAGVAEAYSWLGGTGILRPKNALPRAQEAAMRALELDESLAESHLQMGLLAWALDLDWTNAEGHFLRALDLNPDLPQLHSLYGFFLASMGRLEESLAELHRGLELDPLSQVAHIWLGQVLAWLGSLPESIHRLRTALDLDPSSWNANHILGMAYRLDSDFPKATEALSSALALADRHPWTLMELALVHEATDRRGQAEAVYEELVGRCSGEFVPPTVLGFLSAALGRADEAFHWLEKALEERDTLMTWISILPHFDPLRDDPRFPLLVERVGLDREHSGRRPSIT